MAWGLEARVPFLDKEFLEVSMNIDAKEKMFSKGTLQQKDADGRPKMEKVSVRGRVRRHWGSKRRSGPLKPCLGSSLTPPPPTVHPPKGIRCRTRRRASILARLYPLATEGAVL